MTYLSYSTLNAVINEPHVWLNHINKLPKYTTKFFEEGKEAHKIIQEHVSGKTLNPLLKDLPLFSQVEEIDFDPKTKIEYQLNDKYALHGYVDGFNEDKSSILEIKTSGTPWSMGQFSSLMQWRIYGLATPTAKSIYLVNTPRDPKLWSERTIKIFNSDITEADRQKALSWIQKGIDVIENIGDYNLFPEKKSRWCFFVNCPYCPLEEGFYARNQV